LDVRSKYCHRVQMFAAVFREFRRALRVPCARGFLSAGRWYLHWFRVARDMGDKDAAKEIRKLKRKR